ncbi:MAG: ABC transporter permease [Sellimonas intestinalis]
MMKKYVPKPGRREYVTFLLLFAEIILFGILAPNFLTVDNLIRVIQNNAEIAMVSIGMTIVMLLGGIDLSVGSVMGVIAIVIGYMLQAEMNIFLIVAAAIGIGVAVGFLNGFLVAKFNIPDMIVTIATMNIWKAVIFALLGGKWLTGLNPGYGVITRGKDIWNTGASFIYHCHLCVVLLFSDVQGNSGGTSTQRAVIHSLPI